MQQEFSADQISGVLTGDQFQDVLRDAQLGLSEHDADLLTTFAIRGSRRMHSADSATQPVNTKLDLVQFFNFEKALQPVIKHMRKEHDDQKRKQEQMEQFDDELSKLRREMERRQKEQKDKEARAVDPLAKAREE